MIPRVLVVACVCLGIALLVYVPATAPTITTRFGGVDGGELAATAISGGVPHPSGYPTYMLLARIALRIFPGEAAGRLAYLSALSGALAVACTAALVTVASTSPNTPRPSAGDLLAGLYAGLSLALGTRFWSQTIIPEVYATLMFWLSLSTLLGLIWLRGRQVVVLLAAALCLGLGTGAHLTILALVPAALLAGWTTPDRGAGGSSLAGAVAAFTFGAAIHGLLPIWAARDTLPSWGDQRTLAGLWAHISGAEYRYLAGIVPWSQRIGRLSFAARDLLSQPGLLGLALAAFIGIPSAWEQNRPFMLGTALVALSSLFFAISYGGADGTVYLLPWTWAWSIWAGFGVKAAMDMRGRLIPAPVAIAVMTLVLVGTLGWTAIRQHTTHNLRADVSARDTAVAELERLPAGAILVTADDAQTFGAWYVQRALNIRPDIVIVDSRLLARAWYRTQIRRVLKTAPGVTVCAAVAASGRPMFLAGNDLTTPADAVLEEACVRWEE